MSRDCSYFLRRSPATFSSINQFLLIHPSTILFFSLSITSSIIIVPLYLSPLHPSRLPSFPSLSFHHPLYLSLPYSLSLHHALFPYTTNPFLRHFLSPTLPLPHSFLNSSIPLYTTTHSQLPKYLVSIILCPRLPLQWISHKMRCYRVTRGTGKFLSRSRNNSTTIFRTSKQKTTGHKCGDLIVHMHG